MIGEDKDDGVFEQALLFQILEEKAHPAVDVLDACQGEERSPSAHRADPARVEAASTSRDRDLRCKIAASLVVKDVQPAHVRDVRIEDGKERLILCAGRIIIRRTARTRAPHGRTFEVRCVIVGLALFVV